MDDLPPCILQPHVFTREQKVLGEAIDRPAGGVRRNLSVANRERSMKIWFEGEDDIATDLVAVAAAYDHLGKHYVDVVRRMPGMSSVELIEEGDDFVKIQTNEGQMHRSNITRTVTGDRVVVEFDEEYDAGPRATATSHHIHTFSTTASGVHHHLVVGDVEFPGVLGFFYRHFGRASMGKAFLGAYRAYFEDSAPGSSD